MAFGQAQHLSTERGKSPIIRIELINKIFDLRSVELHTFNQCSQLFAQFVIFILFSRRKIIANRECLNSRRLNFGEFLEQASDLRKLFKRGGL